MARVMICSPDEIIPGKRKEKTYVFLAGPIQGVHDWQSEDIPDIGDDVIFINPRRRVHPDPSFNWKEQVDWETAALRVSDYILFWVPKEEVVIPGRDYAQTTKIELMENLVRGKNIVLGIHPEVHTRRYLVEKFKAYTGRDVHSDLPGCLKELGEMIDSRNQKKETWFTSDTHFGSQRTLELSKRPFLGVEEMNWTMVERWNKVVSPESEVIHLGDFGDYKWARYLNGKIKLLYGNYERKEGEDIPRNSLESYNVTVLKPNILALKVRGFNEDPNFKLILGHEPTNVLRYLNEHDSDDGAWAVFGHIHGRQRIKKFGVDVGVDCNNFYPISLQDLKFYFNAINKHYDEEVWS